MKQMAQGFVGQCGQVEGWVVGRASRDLRSKPARFDHSNSWYLKPTGDNRRHCRSLKVGPTGPDHSTRFTKGTFSQSQHRFCKSSTIVFRGPGHTIDWIGQANSF